MEILAYFWLKVFFLEVNHNNSHFIGLWFWHLQKPVFVILAWKRSNVDVFDFDNNKAITNVSELRVSAYVSCVYNTFWWIGLISEVDVELCDVKIEFLHPHGPRKTFTWPVGGDTCHVPMKNILCSISAPSTATGHTYKILDVDYQNTVSAFEQHNTN